MLAALWSADVPLTPTQLLAAIDGDLAYNTVHTILTRLCEKGRVRKVVVENRPAYTPAQPAADWSAAQMRAVLDRGHDRGAILARFVTSLRPEDERILRDVLSRETGS